MSTSVRETDVEFLIKLGDLIKHELSLRAGDDALFECGGAVTAILPSHPEEVLELAYGKLQTWPFKDVPICWRRAYEEASLFQVLKLIHHHLGSAYSTKGADLRYDVVGLVREWTKILDMAIILTGAPGRRIFLDRIFDEFQQYLDSMGDVADGTTPSKAFPQSKSSNITASTIPRKSRMSLLNFQRHLDAHGGPIIIDNQVTHWPAYILWSNPRYLHRQTLHGNRLVPVELGRSYTDDGWSQQIMPFGAYLQSHLLNPSANNKTGYLAQHDLLEQIPALSNDTITPDLCYADPPEQDPSQPSQPKLDHPLRNAWLGPAGTISPLHTDPYHNILCQVVGRKYVRLYAPSQTEKLYPRGVDEAGVNMENTSRVDVHLARRLFENHDANGANGEDSERIEFEAQFPRFKDAAYVECMLEAGQCLYIPIGWWHYIESLEVSFNVSYWFN
ncbi:hypothetical protein ANO11243_023080 [Dothideomycetidae sp. 11243]|nr:hypothetical protein ANO11243_023080 [fungal sp. No.11243]